MSLHRISDETVEALSKLGAENAAALYDPQTVVRLAREVEVLRRIAAAQHPCKCLLAASPENTDPTVKCDCVCHQQIHEALIIWNPDQLPQHPDVIEEPISE